MPRGDGTGPAGMGPSTGRKAGYCAGYSVPGFMNPYGTGVNPIRSLGGFGRGRGYRNMYYATGLPYWLRHNSYPSKNAAPAADPATEYYQQDISQEEEIRQLKKYSEVLKKQLDEMQGMIDKLSIIPKEE